MLDLVQNFAKYEKQITRYCIDRVRQTYFKSKCFESLKTRCNKMQSCWDLMPGSGSGSQGQRFLAETYYPLVKKQILMRRSLYSQAFRLDPFFMYSPAGSTPQENAINIQDIVASNNKNIKFTQKVKLPAINYVSRYGSAVIITEYEEQNKKGYKTTYDKTFGSSRKYGIYKQSKVANCKVIDPRNYFQNPNIISCYDSDYKGHIERMPLSALMAAYKENPDLFIKENIEDVINKSKKASLTLEEYTDPIGRKEGSDYNNVLLNDVIKEQIKIHIEGNEDDDTLYSVWIAGDKIIRFQDNPYDENMDQYTTLCAEPRFDTWHGNTQAEDSVGNENALNLINGIGLENLIASFNRYIFYNKSAFKDSFNNGRLNFLNPVDVQPGVNINSLIYSYQTPDISGNFNEMMAARIRQNDQTLAASSDLVNSQNSGGATNKTATAANIMNSEGAMRNSDIIEHLSYEFANVGEKIALILMQFLGNNNGVMLSPRNNQQQRLITKDQFLGNYYCETNFQRSAYGEMLEMQNVISWLVNIMGASPQLQDANVRELARQTLRMSQKFNVDDILPEQVEQTQGYQQSSVMPGQEMAGAAQEIEEPDMGMPMGNQTMNPEMAVMQ